MNTTISDVKRSLLFPTFTFLYKNFAKPFFFLFDPEFVHVNMVSVGKTMGKIFLLRSLLAFFLTYKDKRLTSTIGSATFYSPVGLSAGYDYHADLAEVSGTIGFGFHSVGTITNLPYEGNTKPRLGRLLKSRSLMVNKGFKNLGAFKTIEKLESQDFSNAIGISIGKTNHLEIDTQKKSIADIVATFKAFEASRVNHSYYELNISCPNLHGSVTFYKPLLLEELLLAIDKLKITKPIFLKMPISESNKDFEAMLKVVVKHNIAAIIIGNLSKDRKNPKLDPEEVAKYQVGNFSGKATWDRSNELIALAYKSVGKKIKIIGCGGVFSAEDAITKLSLGATYVQLITGMIFHGPTLMAEINSAIVMQMEKMKETSYLNYISKLHKKI